MYVGIIHPTHYTCVKLMLDSGKSVVCEKPLTMNVRDTLSLTELSKERGIFLMEVSCKNVFSNGGSHTIPVHFTAAREWMLESPNIEQ